MTCTPHHHRPLVTWAFLALLWWALPAFAQTTPPDSLTTVSEARALILEDVVLEGATRTSVETVYRYLSMKPGQTIDQAGLVDGVSELRQSGLFKDVSFFTRPGSARGRLVLVLEVREHALDFRWAVGNTNLDGWYLVPAMLAWDNPTGRGDLLDLQWRLGFRHNALLLNYARPWVGDGRDYWATRLSLVSTDRPWFDDGVEYRQQVKSAGLGGVYGRRYGDRWIGELGMKLETFNASNHATAHTSSADGSIMAGDQIEGDELPAGIASSLGRDERLIFQVDVQHDTRSKDLRAGTPVSGIWGRLKTQVALQGPSTHAGVQADFRGYRNAPGGVLALRVRGSVVTDHAPFYDRLYLGGMYTVRGFPTNSLSAPAGDTWLMASSLEYRSRILGDARGTRLAGLFFLDAGAAGEFDSDAFGGVSVGAGYGIRWKVWWLDWIGLDVGFPLTTRPVDQGFQATASIGWSF
jgi:outer membrane protein assembly factor BamA